MDREELMLTKASKLIPLAKTPTGIPGMDDVTEGGIPKGRPTLVCGGAGAGKTLFAMEFLINGVVQYDEPGVFVAFEETAEELAQNVISLGFELNELITNKKLLVEFVQVERRLIEETGEYDLEGLFIRLGYAIDKIKAKRLVLDTIETLFAGLANHAVVRAELIRLFRWLKDKGVTAIVTAERGEGALTRYGLEEYVADCVILLDHRVIDQISTRRLRVVKYRGSTHGTNEYPFLIGKNGFSVLPITSLGLDHIVSTERISSGVKGMDEMLGGKGFYRGSTILLSGTVGAGKSSLAAAFVEAACRRGEHCVYFAFEESTGQIIRNMRSIGIDLEPHLKKGVLQFHVGRPTLFGLEMHLVTMYDIIQQFRPSIVILDPITDFTAVGTNIEIKSIMTRLIDYLKTNPITALLTSFIQEDRGDEQSEIGISSLIDTLILLRNLESHGEMNRTVSILKSRGMAHSNLVRKFWLTNDGIRIGDLDETADDR
jgi:circadian clock protein KaiC